ncbi:unnamed protein product [Colias eurytheme]|nr:unnamed protein product [Colias eurytheme]
MIEDVKKDINSISRIESHYLCKQTTREFVDGGKTLTDIYTDYKEDCIKHGLPYATATLPYRKVFNNDFNISFFVPKKDQCEQCTIYQLAEGPQKEVLKEDYERHLAEKEKSREEKDNDKLKVSRNFMVACYNLQAVMTIPNGEVSTFFYKSKIGRLYFTISELARDNTECFFWDEAQGNRGTNEIGSCVLKYLQKKSSL